MVKTMKKVKMLAAIALLLGVVILMAACGKKNENLPDSGTGLQASANTPKEIAGIVEDVTMNAIAVRDAAGTLYSFATEEAIIDSPSELQIGDEVTVYYTGELDTAAEEQTRAAERVVVTKVAPATGSGETDGDSDRPGEGE